MLKGFRPVSRWTALSLGGLMLAIVLVACGSSTGGTSGSTSTSTQVPTTQSTQSHTPASTAGSMSTITGNGFTLSYPSSWQVTRSGSHLVTLVDSTGMIKMNIAVIPNPRGAISAAKLAETGLNAAKKVLQNSQTQSISPTTTVGGVTWNQGSVSGTTRINNRGTDIQVVVLASVNPPSSVTSKGYTIEYRAPKSTFNQANTTYFQPILQSFKLL